MPRKYGIVIANETVSASNQEWFPAINPYSREEWALVPQATSGQVADAIAAARKASDSVWSKTSGLARATLLNRLADLLDAQAERMAVMESTDNGKVIRETRGQMRLRRVSIAFLPATPTNSGARSFRSTSPTCSTTRAASRLASRC